MATAPTRNRGRTKDEPTNGWLRCPQWVESGHSRARVITVRPMQSRSREVDRGRGSRAKPIAEQVGTIPALRVEEHSQGGHSAPEAEPAAIHSPAFFRPLLSKLALELFVV